LVGDHTKKKKNGGGVAEEKTKILERGLGEKSTIISLTEEGGKECGAHWRRELKKPRRAF